MGAAFVAAVLVLSLGAGTYGEPVAGLEWIAVPLLLGMVLAVFAARRAGG